MADAFDRDRLAQLEQSLGRSRAEIVSILLAELDRAFAELERDAGSHEFESVALAAHAARNSALMLDADGLLDALTDLEAAARAADQPGTQAALERARRAWAVVRRQLAAS